MLCCAAMPRRPMVSIPLALVAMGVSGCHGAATERREVTIAAAADLAAAFRELGPAFEKASGAHPTFAFGSTGLLAKQLEQGAPFDVFAAANVSYAEQVVKAGACDGASRTLYARGRLVAWWKHGSRAVPESLADLADARFVHVAIANPEHAPYGRAAMDALTHAGVLDAVKPKLVYGENVQQALDSAETGNAEVALVALSLAVKNERGSFVIIDDALHAPIDQAMVVCRHGSGRELGKRFVDFVASPAGRAVMRAYGFLLPGETLAAAP